MEEKVTNYNFSLNPWIELPITEYNLRYSYKRYCSIHKDYCYIGIVSATYNCKINDYYLIECRFRGKCTDFISDVYAKYAELYGEVIYSSELEIAKHNMDRLIKLQIFS